MDSDEIKTGFRLLAEYRADTTEDEIYDWLFNHADALLESAAGLATLRAELARERERRRFVERHLFYKRKDAELDEQIAALKAAGLWPEQEGTL